MKNSIQKITCLMISFMAVSCAGIQPSSSSSSQKSSSTQPVHVHTWATTWSHDATNHWHVCRGKDCEEVNDLAAHDFGAWQNVTSVSTLTNEQKYAFANVTRKRECNTCHYVELEGTNILPEVRFDFNPDGANANFATVATKSDLSRPEVSGKITITNCDQKYEINGDTATMKVRGNQTAGWRKKGFRIKFKDKHSLLGLNDGQDYKKWVLLADAKDTCLVRTALGFSLSDIVCKDDEQIWYSDFTPVSVYLNNEYWGLYYLCEQKEVKEGRVNLPEVSDGYKGVDIGYCFELDHYADSAGASDEASEMKKGKDGDPTFRMRYSPRMEQGHPSGPLATGQVNTYTMLSDITDGPTDVHVQADYTNVSGGQLTNNSEKTSNSEQLTFIRARMEALYQVLYEAAINGVAKEINDNNGVIPSSKSVEEVIAQHFDLDAWVDGIIINAVSVPPDLGYSSFYMSYDNSPSGDKKLRYDVPWDFDSNFANRNNFYVNAQVDTYVENTYNTWIYLLYKLEFFKDMVKAKWQDLREAEAFETLFTMMRAHFTNNDAEIHRNHYRWPENDAASTKYNNFDEIREPYKDPAKYKDAEAETISWLAARINYLETKWGTGLRDINTGA